MKDRWVDTTLGEVAEIVGGSTPRTSVGSYWDGGIPWATPKDLSCLDGPSLGATARTITDEGLRSCGATVLPTGSVLLSSRAPIGLVAINTQPMATNQGFKSLVPDPKRADTGFLYWWLRGHRNLLESLGNGATFKEISKSVTSSIHISMPPLEEQRRIAGILDVADSLRAKRREAIAKLDTLIKSIFIDVFGDTYRNTKCWRDTRVLGDIAEVRSGITKGRPVPAAELHSVLYLAVANVQDGHLQLESLKTIDATAEEVQKYALRPGDIVLTEGGDPDKLGRGAVWRGEVAPCIHQNHIFRVRVTSSDLRPEFLAALLSSPRGKRYFLRMAKQTTGIASINMSQLRSFPLLEPPLDVQDEYLDRVSAIDRVHRAMQQSGEHLDMTFSSLQQRAFRGEL